MDKNKKILVIDDNQAFSTVIKEELESEGFLVDVTLDSKIGLQKVFQTSPDLVVLDLIMPFMDGLEVLREIRADEKAKKQPVLLLTQVGDNEKVAKAIELGISAYLVKADHSMPNILRKIKELVNPEKLEKKEN